MGDDIYLIKDYCVVTKEVSSRIQKLLSTYDFRPNIDYLKAIHDYLFDGLLISNGQFRTYEIEKPEPTINNASIDYAEHHTIETYLSYAIREIDKTDCSYLTEDEFVSFIANITLSIWVTHPFTEGNTRTVLVFIQKYLSSLGYRANPIFFKDNFTYFRGALVKAAYTNELYHVEPDLGPLYKFYRLLLFGGDISLEESDLIVFEMFNISKQRHKSLKIGKLIKTLWY